ncbi:hypothetical protein [Rhodococcus aetherivorans]|uniref:hypothetical protein n=1 Tax=Rhodococcus aetherivorans TaxID=191292 RepID=UPI001F418B6F|nr:hypothetical protein [Rhodococcus aetherivorans]
MPDIVIPIHELTGLNLPDLSLKELAAGLPEITAPAPSTTPAPAPAAADVVDRIGATVKQLTRDAPFSMIALAAKDVADTDARIRAQRDDGSWGPWTATEPIDTSRSDRTPTSGPAPNRSTSVPPRPCRCCSLRARRPNRRSPAPEIPAPAAPRPHPPLHRRPLRPSRSWAMRRRRRHGRCTPRNPRGPPPTTSAPCSSTRVEQRRRRAPRTSPVRSEGPDRR